MKPLLGFIVSFPTATVIYLALVLTGNVSFEPLWLAAAIVIDLIDDFVAQALPNF